MLSFSLLYVYLCLPPLPILFPDKLAAARGMFIPNVMPLVTVVWSPEDPEKVLTPLSVSPTKFDRR